MFRRQLKNRRALVTGASSGIGRALAIELAKCGVDLVLLARREDRLVQVAGDVRKLGRRAAVVVGDVTEQESRGRALAAACDEFGGLDIVVNNAGISAHGRFDDADPGRLRPIMEVNFFAPVELIREALPLLRAGDQPVIVNISSILGRRGCPQKSEYSASKFALEGFSEAIRVELAPVGIDVLTVVAGPTDTEFFEHLLENRGDFAWQTSRPTLPEHVARATVRAIRHGRREITPSFRGWLLVAANRWFPRVVDYFMARYA